MIPTMLMECEEEGVYEANSRIIGAFPTSIPSNDSPSNVKSK
jgi:hypothetical protein